MWAIWCQSSPVQNLHWPFSNGQFWIVRTEREVGSSSSVKDWSLGQSWISNFWREVSSWSSKLFRDLRFGRPEILREGREASPCRSHSTWDVNLSQFVIGNVNSGQPCNVKDWKHALLCTMLNYCDYLTINKVKLKGGWQSCKWEGDGMPEDEDFEFELPKLNICRLIKAERDENNM